MKKLLILVMVLAMASLANAVLVSINADGATGSIDVAEDATLTIYCVGDAAMGMDYLDMAIGTAATLALPVKHANAGTMAVVNDLSTISLYDYELIAARGPTDPLIVAGTHFTSLLTVTGDVGETFDVLLIEGASESYNTVQTLSFTIIPEPVTIALLGLGGLLLRRRMA